MRKLFLFVFILFVFQISANENPLLGTWRVYKTKSAYVEVKYSKKECLQAYGVLVTFRQDKIIVQKNKYFSGSMPNHKPIYKIRNVNALKYFKDKRIIRMLECSTTGNVIVMDTGIGVPFEEIVFANDSIISIASDENTYFLKRLKKSDN